MIRRKFLQISSLAGAAALSGIPFTFGNQKITSKNSGGTWPVCLNSSTIRPASLDTKIKVAAEAGYDGIELWINELEDYEKEGGNLAELGLELKEKNLFIPNIIGLWNCMPMEESAWQDSLPDTKERMRKAAAVGSVHVAAIPTPDRNDFDPEIGIKRYKELLKIGREEFGIIVAFEFVGFFKGIHRLGQAAEIALDADDPDACIIMDSFHLFRGGSGFNGLKHLNGGVIAHFHFNDVLDSPPREEQGDKDRVYPGDGILPLVQLLKDLRTIKYSGPISLELFSEELWKQDPFEVARTGLQKINRLIDLSVS